MKRIIAVWMTGALLGILLLAGCTPNPAADSTENVSQTTLAALAEQETARDNAAAETTEPSAQSEAQTSIQTEAQTSTKTSAKTSIKTSVKASTKTSAKASTTTENTTTSKSAAAMSMERAKEIALNDAGLNAAEVTFTKAKLDYDDGIQEYEIEFICGGWEYEYAIHAGTGRILERDKDRAEGHRPAAAPHAPYSAATDISLEKAKEIALKDAGLTAAQVRFTKAKLDYDDGIQEYEIEFVCDGWEYEYVIHAGTGRILEYDRERD